MFRQLWLRRLHQAKRLSEAFMNQLLSWVYPGFTVFAGPAAEAGKIESLASQARYIARPAMAMDALQQRPDGTLAMETPPDPRSGATLVVLDPLEWIHRAHSGPGTAYAAVLWRLLQPRQACRRGRARRIRRRGTNPLSRRRLRLCPRNTPHLGGVIKEDF